MSGTPPSANPADLDSLTALLTLGFRKQMEAIDGMTPVKVIAVTADSKWVTVQPQVPVLNTSGVLTTRAQIAKVSNIQFGAGDFVVHFPVVAGSDGFIWAADRDISLYLQNTGTLRPNTARIKSFSDAIFIPTVLFQTITIAEDDATNLVLQKLDGTVKLSIGATGIVATAPDGLTVNGPFTVNGAGVINDGLTVSGGGSDTLIVTGNEYVVGNIDATGNITPNVPPHIVMRRTVKRWAGSLIKLLGGKA